jgi:hypothetical protein
MTKLQSVSLRFFKGFLAGGLGAVATALASGVVVHSTTDLQKLGLTLAVAFITGGVLAVEKLLSWTDAPQP